MGILLYLLSPLDYVEAEEPQVLIGSYKQTFLGEFKNYEKKSVKFTDTYYEKLIKPTNGLHNMFT